MLQKSKLRGSRRLLGAKPAPRQVLTAKIIKNTSVLHCFIIKSLKNIREYSNYAVSGSCPAPPKDTLLEAFSHHVAIQRRPEAENV